MVAAGPKGPASTMTSGDRLKFAIGAVSETKSKLNLSYREELMTLTELASCNV
jgi:hypothetical protein